MCVWLLWSIFTLRAMHGTQWQYVCGSIKSNWWLQLRVQSTEAAGPWVKEREQQLDCWKISLDLLARPSLLSWAPPFTIISQPLGLSYLRCDAFPLYVDRLSTGLPVLVACGTSEHPWPPNKHTQDRSSVQGTAERDCGHSQSTSNSGQTTSFKHAENGKY